MQRLKGRLGKLESVLASRQAERFRVICEDVGHRLDLAESSCTRYITNGHLFEVVNLHGSRDHLSDEQLEEFIQSFPIQDNDALPGRKWA